MSCAYIDFGHFIFIFIFLRPKCILVKLIISLWHLQWVKKWQHDLIVFYFSQLYLSGDLQPNYNVLKWWPVLPLRLHHQLCLPLGLVFVLLSSDLYSPFSSVSLKVCEILKWIRSEICKLYSSWPCPSAIFLSVTETGIITPLHFSVYGSISFTLTLAFF